MGLLNLALFPYKERKFQMSIVLDIMDPKFSRKYCFMRGIHFLSIYLNFHEIGDS